MRNKVGSIFVEGCLLVMLVSCGGGGSTSNSVSTVAPDDNYEQTRSYPSHENLRPELPIGQSAVGNLAEDTYDQYPVNLVAGTLYEFKALGKTSGGGTLRNPAIRLVKPDDGIDEFSDNLAVVTTSLTYQYDPQMPFIAPVSGTYYLRVSGFETGDVNGSYSVSARTYSLERDIIPTLIGFRWNQDVPLGTPTTLSYCFLSSLGDAGNYAAANYNGFSPMTEEERSSVKRSLLQYAAWTSLTFVEQPFCTNSTIHYGIASLAARGSGGETGLNFSPSGQIVSADTFFDSIWFANFNEDIERFRAIMHETGHALGLKHPGNYSGSTGIGERPFIPLSFDNDQYSVVSYVRTRGTQSTPAIFDIAALQYLYGSNRSGVGTSQTYRFADGTSYIETIPSNGSSDTIDVSGVTTDTHINLVGGSFSSIGLTLENTPAHNNVAIPFGATVYDVVGGGGNDYLIGNELDNTLSGGPGNDILDGAEGTNTASYSGKLADFTIKKDANGIYTVTDLVGQEGIDTLSHIQRIKFSDMLQAVSIDDLAQ